MTACPIRRRGNFFRDEYFKGFQNDFDSAINNVMDKYGGRSLLADQFSNYRNLEDSGPVASISDTENSYVIVLDMSAFLQGSITVCTRGKNAIVEAKYEDKEYKKKFPLPKSTDLDKVKSAMSDEGILTISAPKKESNGPSTASGDTAAKSYVSDEPLKLNVTSDLNRQASVAESSPPPTPSETRRLNIDKRGKFFQDSKFENVWDDFEKAMSQMEQREMEREEAKAQRRARRDAIFENYTKDFFDRSSRRERKKDFFGDIFEDFFGKDDKDYKKFFTDSHKFFERRDDSRSKFFEDDPHMKDFFDRKKKDDEIYEQKRMERKKRLEKDIDDFFGRSKEEKDVFGDEFDFAKRKTERKKMFDDDFGSSQRKKVFENEFDFAKKDQRAKDFFDKDFDAFDRKKESRTKVEEEFNIKDRKSREASADKFSDYDIPRFSKFKAYRNLRNWDPENETRAVAVKQTANDYNILVDVKDVSSDSLSVQAVDDGLIVGGGTGNAAFKRKFSLPGAVSFDNVNATLSDDGILTIIVPKH